LNQALSPPAPAGARIAAPSASRQSLLVLGAALGMGCGFAALYFSTLSVFLKPLTQEFGWGRAQISAATGLAMVGMAMGSFLVGRIVDRFGAARVVATSVLLMAALVASLSRLPNRPGLLALLSFAIGLVGVGTAPPGYLSVLARTFDRRLGLALGAAMVGLGLGTMAMPVLAQQLISAQGWRAAYVNLAGLSVVLAAFAFLLLFGGKRAASPAAHAPVRQADMEGDTLRQAITRPRFWALVVILLLVSAAGLGSSVHIAALLTDRGLDVTTASRVVALTGAGVTLGRLVTGALLDLVPAPRLGALAFLLGALGLGMLAFDPMNSVAGLSAGAFLSGFVIGAEGDFIPYAVRRYFGLRSFGAIFGALFGVYALGGVAGPVGFGLAFDAQGSYGAIYASSALVCGCCAFATLLLGSYRFHSAAP
jgi:predicted MFS family arabinose efflux permease